MPDNSRREFLGSCAYVALAVLTGCGQRGNSTSSSADGYIAFEPGYLALHRTGELKKRGEELWALMESCELCPRRCGAARLAGGRGFCGSDSHLEIASFHPHHGEERPLSGHGGSGTIFFSNCGLRCVFCINWEVSQGGMGERREVKEMAAMMLRLQEIGCHNINIVTPTHYSPHILLALDIAAGRGLRLPLVYNTCGWERLEILRRLEGIVDIYLPVMDGDTMIRALRKDPRWENLPIIAVSAGAQEARQRALKAGADFFLDKPLRLSDVLSTVRRLLATRPETRPEAN